MKLLTNKLYESILMQPALSGADTLKIVSGFASPTMALRHLEDLKKRQNKEIDIYLIYGMSKHHGVEIATHRAFVDIQENQFNNFKCYYSYRPIPLHAKVYTWMKKDKATACYAGSANYTQNGFSPRLQQEAMTKTSADDGLRFYNRVSKNCIICNHSLLEDHICLYRSNKKQEKSGLPEVELSLLDTRTGETHKKAGLNWGKRQGREQNQAYIPIPRKTAESNYFPRENYFTIITDDDFSFIAKRAQQNKKAIHSTDSNAILGKYFRDRLGLEDGAFITRKHLEDYGRTSVRFMKIDDETYMMDFSSKRDTTKDSE